MKNNREEMANEAEIDMKWIDKNRFFRNFPFVGEVFGGRKSFVMMGPPYDSAPERIRWKGKVLNWIFLWLDFPSVASWRWNLQTFREEFTDKIKGRSISELKFHENSIGVSTLIIFYIQISIPVEISNPLHGILDKLVKSQ